jgi:uncharacterized repeat protein (TIGR02543 family)
MGLAFIWKNDGSAGSVPAAIDNVVITGELRTPVTGVSLNKTSTTLYGIGRTEWLEAICTPYNADNQTVTWSSSNTSVARVEDYGRVTAVSAGTATITATTVDGGFTASCAVTVSANIIDILPNYTFENGTDISAWMFVSQAEANQWHIGTATSYEGSRSMYISNNGASYDYTNTAADVSYAGVPVTFASTSASYTLTFKWKCVGEGWYDNFSVYLLPDSAMELSSYYRIGESYYGGQNSWQTATITFTPSQQTDMLLVFSWENNNSASNGVPAAIDNVVITRGDGSVVNALVTFDAQGGSTVPSQTIVQGGYATQPANPTKSGYTFGGWYKEAGCTNAWNFNTDIVTAHVTLYAKWIDASVPTYTVTFNTNGGSTIASQIIAQGAKATQPAAPTKEGYTFGGWYKEAACTNVWNFNTDIVTANETLYAKWTQGSSPTDPNNPNTAVETQGIASLQIYPNPVVNGQLIIDNGQFNAGDKVEIYNMNGVLVGTYSIRPAINIGHLPTGIYIVKVGGRIAKVLKQ